MSKTLDHFFQIKKLIDDNLEPISSGDLTFLIDLSERTIQRHTTRLFKEGLVGVTVGSFGTYLYYGKTYVSKQTS